MTAAVPDPRFRDQLAEALVHSGVFWPPDVATIAADALMPTIAAEVEAAVQAAANQRAAVVGRCGNCDAIADTLPCPFCAAAKQRAAEAERVLEAQYRAAWDAWAAVTKPGDEVSPSPEARAAWARVNQTLDDKDAVAAALASPAPAPRAEEGRR